MRTADERPPREVGRRRGGPARAASARRPAEPVSDLNGTFTVHDSAQEVEEFMAELKSKGVKPAELVKQMAQKFDVSERTARRWRNG